MIGQLFKSLFHAFFKILLSLVICTTIGGGAVLVVSYVVLGHWPPSRLKEGRPLRLPCWWPTQGS